MHQDFSICATCGVEHSHPLPEVCAICADERQYLPADGVQRWTSLDDLHHDRTVDVWEVEPKLFGLTTTPKVGIGHRPLLIQTSEGNLLWDPPGYIDASTIATVRDLGGIRWIASSHPHMYGVQLEWSAAFDSAMVLANERDSEWLARNSAAIELWDGQLELTPDLKLIRLGGHFAGSTVAHWRGADGAGVLLSSDTIFPVAATGWVTFLRSYPNRLPLSAGTVKRITDQMLLLDFERLYGNFHDQPITSNAKQAVKQSAERHIAWVSGEFDHLT